MFVSLPTAAIVGALPVAEFAMSMWFTALAVVVNENSSFALLSEITGAAMLNCKPLDRIVATVVFAITWRICALVVEVM
jgi:hypothetical protein